tara:strand:- start:1324 stop:1479 length:156 start_codon:yes stop_codon:yes gene_type:complete
LRLYKFNGHGEDSWKERRKLSSRPKISLQQRRFKKHGGAIPMLGSTDIIKI